MANRISAAGITIDRLPTSARRISAAGLMVEWRKATLYSDLTSKKMYVYLDDGWTDIAADTVGEINMYWGIGGITPNDRIADTGVLEFTLWNRDGYYTPGGASVKAGWGRDTAITVELQYEGETYVRWKGVVENIDLQFAPGDVAFAKVTAVDWMNYAAEQPITTPALQRTIAADRAIQIILNDMPVKPASKILDTGITTFPYVFDVVKKKSRAMSEFSQLVNSEMGYLYLRKNQGDGEQLVFENAQHRSGLLEQALIPKAGANYLLKEDGDKILQESDDKIYLSETELFDFTGTNAGTMNTMQVDHGANTANRVTVTAYPRKVDTSVVTLYELGSPIEIGNGETKTWTGSYSYNGQSCGGYGMLNPAATSNYTLNTLADGTGTSLTSTAIVSVTFGGNSATISVTNASTSSGYITLFKLSGYGVYTYAETTLVLEDSASINANGYYERQFDQTYQNDLANGSVVAQNSLFYDRNPRTVLQSITYCANRSSQHMYAMLGFDVGDLIKIAESSSGISGSYIIQSVNITLQPGGIIWVAYGLVEHHSLLMGTMTGLELTFATSTRDAVDFGYLPQVVQTSARTYSAWVNCSADYSGVIFSGPFADGGGVLIYRAATNDNLAVYTNLFDTDPGRWYTPNDTFEIETLYHIAVVYDCWDVDAVPVVYINGNSQVMTESLTPAGNLNSEYGARLVLGNWKTDTQDYTYSFSGTIKDWRIYNRLLTEAEVDAIYNAGTPSLTVGTTNGLVFQAAVVPIEMDDSYDSATLTTSLQVLDNIYGAVGTPVGSVTSALIA